jgi:hypothetical protein
VRCSHFANFTRFHGLKISQGFGSAEMLRYCQDIPRIM